MYCLGMLTFNPEGHVYFWNGKEVPSVSAILKSIGITRDYDRGFVDPFYKERGKFVHQAVEYHVKGTLDEDSIDQENVLPYLRGFQKFEREEHYVVNRTEIPLYSQKYRFAGAIDQCGEIIKHLDEGIVDLKVTEKSDKAADLQLCAYAHLYHENFGKWPSFRMVLELHGDQTAKPIYYETDPQIWGAVMDLYRWKTTRRKSHADA